MQENNFLKRGKEFPGDGVCALFDDPESNLRLYCISYGTQLVVVGGGGYKSKSIRSFQEDENLKSANYFLRWLSSQITNRIREKEISYSNNFMDFDGNLNFNTEED